VIDYVFRELAISYLGREELAQVHSEDLRNTTMGARSLDEEFTEEEVVSETVYENEPPKPNIHDNMQLHPHSRGMARNHDGHDGGSLAMTPTVAGIAATTGTANAALLRAEPQAARANPLWAPLATVLDRQLASDGRPLDPALRDYILLITILVAYLEATAQQLTPFHPPVVMSLRGGLVTRINRRQSQYLDGEAI
jgi:hypothetical protein